MTSLSWAIVDNSNPTDPTYGTTLFSGTVSGAGLTDSPVEVNAKNFAVDEVSFSLGSDLLGAGTYWLMLLDGAAGGAPVGWDQSDGASVAWDNGAGLLANTGNGCGGVSGALGTTCSESFQIIGPSTTTPEPGSLMLFGSGMLLLAGAWRRKASR
jgi:hypothetical protein